MAVEVVVSEEITLGKKHTLDVNAEASHVERHLAQLRHAFNQCLQLFLRVGGVDCGKGVVGHRRCGGGGESG